MTDFVTLHADGCYFEGPRWHHNRWWVSDVYDHRVLSVSPEGRAEEVLQVEGQPSGLGWMPDGSLLVVSMKTAELLRRRPDGTVTVHASLRELVVGELNDLVVDGTGRAYAGAVGFDLLGGETPRPSVLIRVEPDGQASVAAEGLMFPNGTVLHGDQLIVAETYGARLTSYTRGTDGTLSDGREWASRPQPFAPDGCAVDLDGCVWVADAATGKCFRLAPSGETVAEINAPDGLMIFAVALGGPHGTSLLACAAPGFDPADRIKNRDAKLLVTEVTVPAANTE